jgi:hypothetical protein
MLVFLHPRLLLNSCPLPHLMLCPNLCSYSSYTPVTAAQHFATLPACPPQGHLACVCPCAAAGGHCVSFPDGGSAAGSLLRVPGQGEACRLLHHSNVSTVQCLVPYSQLPPQPLGRDCLRVIACSINLLCGTWRSCLGLCMLTCTHKLGILQLVHNT